MHVCIVYRRLRSLGTRLSIAISNQLMTTFFVLVILYIIGPRFFSATLFLFPASSVPSKLSQIFSLWSTGFLDAQTYLHSKNVVASSRRWTATRLLWKKSHYSCDTRCAFDVEYVHSWIEGNLIIFNHGSCSCMDGEWYFFVYIFSLF